MEKLSTKIRRVVTGHDREGRSVVVLDDQPIALFSKDEKSSRKLVEVWATVAKSTADVSENAHVTGKPEPNASEIRIVDMAPGSRREMHRTDTIDYGIVIVGEVYLILEGGETLLRPGDVVVQRGTNHSWHNKSADVARLAFVNISGHITDHDRCPKV